MTPETTRGGAREGSGRPKSATRRKAVTVRILPEDAERLREICRHRATSQAKFLTESIRQASLGSSSDSNYKLKK